MYRNPNLLQLGIYAPTSVQDAQDNTSVACNQRISLPQTSCPLAVVERDRPEAQAAWQIDLSVVCPKLVSRYDEGQRGGTEIEEPSPFAP